MSNKLFYYLNGITDHRKDRNIGKNGILKKDTKIIGELFPRSKL